MTKLKYGYLLANQWFDFASKNSALIKPVHSALYFWICELNNRLFWRETFGLPTLEAMKMIGIKDRRHYRATLQDLEKWGFIRLVSKSKNQHAANKVSLVTKNSKMLDYSKKNEAIRRIAEEENSKRRNRIA